mgnify:CR=1 FL=1
MRTFKLVGLTGRTGSGKSIVREVFGENGYEIIDADLLAREAVKNRIVKGDILAAFGVDLLKSDESIDRKELAKRAFKNDTSVKTLNSIIHPHITQLFMNELKKLSDNGSSLILFDAPQLFESGLDVICDLIIGVYASDELRIKRISERDNISDAAAKQRLNIQLPDSFFKENCDYYLENNSTAQALKTAVRKVISLI